MTRKLTLSISEEVVAQAKVYAKNTGRSLSDIIEHYLKAISMPLDAEQLSTRVQRLKGAIRLPEDFDEQQTIEDALSKKYEG